MDFGEDGGVGLMGEGGLEKGEGGEVLMASDDLAQGPGCVTARQRFEVVQRHRQRRHGKR